jgi:hypothetical protein
MKFFSISARRITVILAAEQKLVQICQNFVQTSTVKYQYQALQTT